MAIHDDKNIDDRNIKLVYISSGNVDLFIDSQTFKLINGDIIVIYNQTKYIAREEDNNTKK